MDRLGLHLGLALREWLARIRRRSNLARDHELSEIFKRVARIPRRDPRSDDELLGYNEIGTFDGR